MGKMTLFMEDMEYIIYCDESVSNGKIHTDFFGGVLVRNTDYDSIRNALNGKKTELNLQGEIKWVKVTENYLDKYKMMMVLFFSFIKENRLKVRIMFRETSQTPSNLNMKRRWWLLQNKEAYELQYDQSVKYHA